MNLRLAVNMTNTKMVKTRMPAVLVDKSFHFFNGEDDIPAIKKNEGSDWLIFSEI